MPDPTPEQQLCVWLTLATGQPCAFGLPGRHIVNSHGLPHPILLWTDKGTFQWARVEGGSVAERGTFTDEATLNAMLTEQGMS